ncbi:hypothetical protein [Bradyrhizobium sp. STM 3809]|uniref:hypothetical protein n=1 Tax=Bradyrhizobium sp. STM 3809 TaxID=551936 RepID=UPI0003142F0D|nr:hypothetical protein [Bradyrhizobium sp. STM 3809]
MPSKTRTITIHSQGADDQGMRPSPPTAGYKLLTIKPVQPQPGDGGAAGGGQSSDGITSGNISSEGLHKIRTFQVRQAPGDMDDGFRHLVPTTPVPAESAPK